MSDPNGKLRPARIPEDADLVYRLKFGAYADYIIEARGSWDETFQRRYTSEHLMWTRIIEIDENAAGYVACKEEPQALKITDMHILPEYQGRGIGSGLLEEILREADARRITVKLDVLRNNAGARALYERFGFRQVAEQETHVQMEREPAE